MNRYWLGLLLPVAGSIGQAVAADRRAPEFELEVKGRIEIGPDGRVLKYTVDDDTTTLTAVKDLVRKAVNGWRFNPIIDNGRPVIGVTQMSLHLSAIPDGEDYVVRIDTVDFGTSPPLNLKPPAYPPDLVRQGVSGKVVLVLHVDEHGKVTQVHPERTDLGEAGTKGQMDQWRHRFEAVAIKTARTWRFPPIEVLDGKPVAGDVRVPIAFQFDGNLWQARYRGASTPAPWIAEQRVASNDAVGDSPASIGSHFELQSDVVGKML